jgi:hypothetical protein
MSDPVNGVDMLAAIIVIVLLAGTLWYAQWKRQDRIARLKRLAKRGLA